MNASISRWGAVALTVLLLSGCSHMLETESQRNARKRGEAQAKADKGKYVYASLGPVNHTGQFLYMFYVDGTFGSNMYAYKGGAPDTCCVRLPIVYQPGMQVKVEWNMPEGVKDVWKSKMVAVEPYAEPGSVYVHFFPSDEIRVVVSNRGAHNPNHPIPAPIDPRKSQEARP